MTIKNPEALQKMLDDLHEIINCVEDEVPKEWTHGQCASKDYNEGYHRAIYGLRLLIHARGL